MPNDAKLGLVVGVALVLAVAVVFFRKESAEGEPATSVGSGLPVTTQPPPRTSFARATNRSTTDDATVRRHTVRDGETLFSLAQHYYGDGARFDLISRTNDPAVDAETPLPAGTVLVIPEADAQR